MYKLKTIHIFAAFVFLGLIHAAGSTAEVKTITRMDDPIIMDASKFTDLFGVPVDQLALMVFRGDTWHPIPFQIDQKKPDGTYAFTKGAIAGDDPDPNLDANDELVFMIKDVGDRMTKDVWPDGTRTSVEIAVTDPKNGYQGWVYLTGFSCTAPRSPEDYIALTIMEDENNNYRCVKTYEYEMRGASDRVFPDYLAVNKSEDGSPGVDILDRMKIRGKIKLVGITIPVKFEEIIKCKDLGYIDGPIRVLIDADGILQLFGFIKVKGKMKAYMSWYVNYLICRIVMDVPKINTGIVNVKELYGYLDHTEAMYGAHIFNAANPYNDQIVLDGVMSEAEKKLDTDSDMDWIAAIGPNASLFSRLFWVPRPEYLLQTLYYNDDKNSMEPPDDHPGSCSVGYDFKDFIEPKKDGSAATLDLYFYAKKNMVKDEVNKILDILDNPVNIEVTTKPIEVTTKPLPE